MQKICYYFISLLIIVAISFTSIYAGAVIVEFKGNPGKNKVVIKWSTMSETNCHEFQIERSLDRNNFQKVGSVEASGNSSDKKDYTFEDNSVFKAASNTFYYRIRICDFGGKESLFSEIISVTPSVSGVKHTWGSIKALFR